MAMPKIHDLISVFQRLRDYLPLDVKNIRVLLYGYPTQLQDSMAAGKISDYSNNLIEDLISMRVSARVSGPETYLVRY